MKNWIWMCAILSLMHTLNAVADEKAIYHIGSRRELFVDDFLLASRRGIQHVLHHPRPAERSATLDKPWERHFYNGISVIKDGRRFLMYYSAGNRLAVAVSDDGKRWRKPALGLILINGSRQNNLVGSVNGKLMIGDRRPLPEVFLDRRPGVKRSERFKAFTLDERRDGTRVHAWLSGDGFKFRRLRKKEIIKTRMYGAFDGFESLFWSPTEQQYVLYIRYAIRVSPPDPKDPNRRSVARMTSKDFVHWTQPQPMTFGEAGLLPPDHHYNNQTTPYFRAPHIYIALSNRLAQNRPALTRKQAIKAKLQPSGTQIKDPLKWLINDCADTVMMTTRGGTHYDRLFMEGLVRPGLGARNWVSRSNYTLRGLHRTGPTEMSIWVSRHNGQPSSHVRRYTFRLDGIVSLRARWQGGEFVTRPMIFAGRSLELNYSTSAVGSIRVEVQDMGGKSIPGFALGDGKELIGDRIAGSVQWKGDLRELAGEPIRLRFVMRDADLYSLRFRP